MECPISINAQFAPGCHFSLRAPFLLNRETERNKDTISGLHLFDLTFGSEGFVGLGIWGSKSLSLRCFPWGPKNLLTLPEFGMAPRTLLPTGGPEPPENWPLRAAFNALPGGPKRGESVGSRRRGVLGLPVLLGVDVTLAVTKTSRRS